jgi:hypothetical protein
MVQIPNRRKAFWSFEIEIWDLEFGIWNFNAVWFPGKPGVRRGVV